MIPLHALLGAAILKQRPVPAKAGLSLLLALLAAVLLSAGCEKKARYMELSDLTEGEMLFVTRYVVLERAKAVALTDRPLGNTLLDSLAAAWGDSSLEKTLAGTPTDPIRATQVADLLRRILAAERDSLMLAPRPDRLAAPLPDPGEKAPGPAAPGPAGDQ